MRAVQKGERRPTSSVFKSIESLSRFNDRCFDPFRALLFSPSTKARIRITLLSWIHSRYCTIAPCLENRARSSRIVNFSSNVTNLSSFRKKFEFWRIKKSICLNIVVSILRKLVSS